MLSLLFLSLTVIQAKHFLLTPKLPISINFITEHGLEKFATFDNMHIYKTNQENFNIFSGSFSDLFYVEEEQEYYTQQQGVFHFNQKVIYSSYTPWHLDRIDKRHLPLNESYLYNKIGSCHTNKDVIVNTYVVDTGVDVTHSEFEDRAEFLENFTDDSQNYDGNGHGTHCSGLIGGKSFGVCKDARIFGVKVLDSDGSGTTSGVIAGMEFVYNRHISNQGGPVHIKSIISMSLGGGYSRIMNMAIETMLKNSQSMYIVVAAGNENQDACKTSPASANGVFTVMASDINDKRAYFSNYGKCCDIYTPGVNIRSSVPGNKTAVYSGTSMATPILVGVLNHYLHMYPHMNMSLIKQKIMLDSTRNTILKNKEQSTKNLFVYLQH